MIAVAALGLAGCATSEPPSLSGVPTPARFEANADARAPQMSRWWARFGSRELDALMRAADVGNFDVAVAVAQLDQAEAQAQIAGSSLFPVVSFSADASRASGSGTLGSGPATRTRGRNVFDGALGASYVVDVWGANRDLLDAAVRSASASAYQIEVVRSAMRASLANAFFTLAANRERVRVAQGNIASAERVLRVYRQRKSAGTASDLEIAQQTALTESQRASLPPLRQAADQARVTLALLTGRPAQAVHPAVSSVTALRAPHVSPGLPSALLVRRPDVRAAEEQLRAAEADVSAARKAMLPQIQLTGQAGLQSAALSRLFRPESVIYSLAAGLMQPIFDGGRLRAEAALSDARRRELLEAYRKSIVSALTDVESALIAVRETSAREAGQALAAAAARRAFALSEERLAQGTIDLATLLSAQQTSFQAQDALVQARLARLQALASLFQALGGDWSAERANAEPMLIDARISTPGLALPTELTPLR